MDIQINHLQRALLRWEEASRAGKCESVDDAAKRPAEEVAALAVQALWGWLQEVASEGETVEANSFVIVAIGTFEVETLAYFASTRAKAETAKAEAEAKHGVEFAIFGR